MATSSSSGALVIQRVRLDDTPGLTGAVQGLNGRERPGYLGPRPPAGEGPHRYHFQLFALGLRLDLSATAPLEDLVQALKVNTIASCQLIGIYEQEAPADRAVEIRSFTEERTFETLQKGDDRAGAITSSAPEIGIRSAGHRKINRRYGGDQG
jgi:hypothetical protein